MPHGQQFITEMPPKVAGSCPCSVIHSWSCMKLDLDECFGYESSSVYESEFLRGKNMDFLFFFFCFCIDTVCFLYVCFL